MTFRKSTEQPVIVNIQARIEETIIGIYTLVLETPFLSQSLFEGGPCIRQGPAKTYSTCSISGKLTQKPNIVANGREGGPGLQQHESKIEGKTQLPDDFTGL